MISKILFVAVCVIPFVLTAIPIYLVKCWVKCLCDIFPSFEMENDWWCNEYLK